MEIKVSQTLLYFDTSAASVLELCSELEFSNDWTSCIATLSENGAVNIFNDLNGIKGHLLFKPAFLNSGWSVITDALVPDTSMVPTPPKNHQNMYLFCLRYGKIGCLWFLLKSKHERDSWVEAILKMISCSVSVTPPSTPYSEYDNCPVYPKIDKDIVKGSIYSSSLSSITFQPRLSDTVCSEPSGRTREYTVNSCNDKHAKGRFSNCCCTILGESVSTEDIRYETGSSNCFQHQEKKHGFCVDCCNLFCLSIMPGCTFMC